MLNDLLEFFLNAENRIYKIQIPTAKSLVYKQVRAEKTTLWNSCFTLKKNLLFSIVINNILLKMTKSNYMHVTQRHLLHNQEIF